MEVLEVPINPCGKHSSSIKQGLFMMNTVEHLYCPSDSTRALHWSIPLAHYFQIALTQLEKQCMVKDHMCSPIAAWCQQSKKARQLTPNQCHQYAANSFSCPFSPKKKQSSVAPRQPKLEREEMLFARQQSEPLMQKSRLGGGSSVGCVDWAWTGGGFWGCLT